MTQTDDARNAYAKGLSDALGLIASLGYGKNLDVDEGHEEAFCAVERYLNEWQARADLAATALLSIATQPVGAVKVKPLVWSEVDGLGGRVWDAIAIHTTYRIVANADGQYWLTELDRALPSLKAAKAVAEMHNRDCIMSALEPTQPDPLADPRVTALVDALRFYAWENEARLPSEGPWGAASTDFGQVARAALTAFDTTGGKPDE